MGRPTVFKHSVVISTRFEEEDYRLMQEIASLRSSYGKEKVSAQDLIRYACNFCYKDEEVLREVFRRHREHINRRMIRTSGK